MHKRRRWLAYAAVITGFILVGLLLLALNRDPLTRGFKPAGDRITLSDFCFWCASDQDVTTIDILGIILIGFVVLAIPAGHIALLVALASSASRPPRFSDLEPAYHCPHCNHGLVKQWRVCPYCGVPIEPSERKVQNP